MLAGGGLIHIGRSARLPTPPERVVDREMNDPVSS
jgi:hypothetical protein